MARRRARKNNALMTDAELELMQVLWRLRGGSVRDVLEALPAERKRAYTSVATVMKILEDKGFATSHKDGRTLIYAPAVAKDRYEARNLRHLVGDLFGGDPMSLVRRLISTNDLSEDDLREMQSLVEDRLTE